MNKTQFITAMMEATGLTKAQVNQTLEALSGLAKESLRKEGSFVVPGLVKIMVKDKPATPERQGINPFTKQPVTYPAKPASKKLKVTAVKDLKTSVTG